jgi:cytochrome c-type biogenesis protein CcmH
MIWLLIAGLSLLALAPLGWSLWRPAALRGRRDADLALYQAQRAELDREREAGRLDEAGHRAGLLEVQRRLLSAPEDAAPPPAASNTRRLALLAMAPALALSIYAARGTPEMPSMTYAERQAAVTRGMAAQGQEEALLARLREALAAQDPASDRARQGYIMLGNAERTRGRPAEAATAFATALAARFEADLAAQLAQVLLESDQTEAATRLLAEARPQAPEHIGLRFLSGLAAERAGNTAEARATWQALIAEAPAEAPWRAMVSRRLEALP